MIKKLQHIFALSEKGAKDLVKAVIWCFVCNLALMFPIGAVLFTIQHLLGCLEGGGSPTDGFWLYVGFALAVLVLLFVLHWFQYASLYIATYRESANRRVSLAETLRRLPLSFFGNRDLSDLTSTMIADCSSLDQMFSHYEQGRMGWFGMDDATNESICQYEEKFQLYLQEAREKGLAITIVDCHI